MLAFNFYLLENAFISVSVLVPNILGVGGILFYKNGILCRCEIILAKLLKKIKELKAS